jgi:hypothetical protein
MERALIDARYFPYQQEALPLTLPGDFPRAPGQRPILLPRQPTPARRLQLLRKVSFQRCNPLLGFGTGFVSPAPWSSPTPDHP